MKRNWLSVVATFLLCLSILVAICWGVYTFYHLDNQVYTDTTTGLHDIPLASPPIAFKALPDGVHFIALESDGTLEYITSAITGIPVSTPTKAATYLCPMTVGHTVQSINLQQGKIHPLNFFVSTDGTQLYVVASDRSSVLVYNFSTGGVGGIQLIGPSNPTPVNADMTVDGNTIIVAGSDGMVHQVSTSNGGADQFQFAFPDLANYTNPFCTYTPASGACTFDYVSARP